MNASRIPFSAALALAAAVQSAAQTVDGIFLGKSVSHVQTDAGTVIVDPTPAGGAYGGAYGFDASVEGTGLAAPTVTLAAGSTMPSANSSGHNGGVLGFNSEEGEWQYGSPNFNNWGTETSGELDSLFADGDYTFSISGFSDVTLSLNPPGTAVNTPAFSLTGGAWGSGEYAVDPGQTLTLTTNAFTAFNSNVDGHIYFEIFDVTANSFVHESGRLYSDDTGADNFVSHTVNPGTLVAGHEYRINAGFAGIVDSDSTIASSLSVAFHELDTSMTVTAIPEPSTYAGVLAAVALAAAVRHRRKQRGAASRN